MHKKYIYCGIFVIIISFVCYFNNIIFAVLSNNAAIDRSTISAMLQGKLHSITTTNLKIRDKDFTIPLPKGAGKLSDNIYLIPKKLE